jgi:predicted O-linked N-acetylglucosamine transferase (SPINDLY family)
LDDAAAAARIAADQIDILVDVNGHTRDARPGVFARRPVPVQVNWLGFPGSMGTPFHQYIIADETIIPAENEKFYSERVLRLPCYQPNDRKRIVGRTPTRAEAGLPDGAFVYCCFNGIHKISRFTFDRWMDVLRRTEGSVLWLLSPQPETQLRLAAAAEARGVSGARLIFAPRLNNSDHLARYPLADLFLDTSPYGAHTTASDALWMGVPVVTVLGRSFASRVCSSLVRAAGLPELVTRSNSEFVELSVKLCQERETLQGIQARLASGRDDCVLFDTPLLARSLENLYRQMAMEARAGHLPVPDLTNLEAYLDAGVSFDHDNIDVGASLNYEDMYRTALARRHLARPLPPDRRLWTQDALEEAERAFAVASVARDLTSIPSHPFPAVLDARRAS